MSGFGLRVIVKNAATTMGRQVAAGAIQLVTFVIIARVFGPEGNGQYAVALLLPIFLVTLFNLGIGPANVYHLGAGKVKILTALKVSIKLWLILSVAGLTFGSAVIFYAANILFPGIDTLLIWLSLAVFPLSLLHGFVVSVFQGMQRFNEYNFILLVQPIATLVLISVGLVVGVRDIEYVIVVYIVGILTALLLSFYFISSDKEEDLEGLDNAGYSGDAINYGYKSNLSNILAYVNYKADIFMVNYLIGTSAAGVYIVAVQLVERLWLLSQSVSIILFPRLSQLSSDEEKRRMITPIMCRWVIALTLLGGILLGILSLPLIQLLFGRAYIDSILPLLFLLPGIIAGSGAKILANDIAARGRPELNMYTSWVVVVVNIAGNFILIPIYGLIGAAIATSVAYVSNLLLKLLIYSRFSGNKWRDTLFVKQDDVRMLLLQIRKRVIRN